ncbi:FAD-dependent oxidoreductase [Staphylococcus xylosus]|uniref:NAD(P)/FAD-dependent oxidoreductase n=1 Tax=Staphylococcus xylosus TaxID=1288 RepID=UPI00203D5EDA|nr:FAD-dependent oxidoreductase [Staphylococcus xylosus]MCM3519825.1 FAD-dependent oxidoreductase [Staphylococcus xylosus]
MTNSNQTIAIVGSGVSGVYAAESLRAEGYTGKIALIDKDTNMPYDRPPLSKEFILNEVSENDINLIGKEKFKELDVDLKLGITVMDIDIDEKVIILSNGEKIVWNKLILATGSSLRTLQLDGANLDGIHYLKTLNDALSLKEKLKNINHITIVGAGFIGAELASSLKKLGKEVTILERSPLPLSHILGEEMGKYFLQMHQNSGVQTIMEDSVVQFNGQKNVEEVVTKKGKVIPCQAVVVGVGVIPNTQLLDNKLNIERGYVVDEYCQTSIPDVYAVGDCSMWPFLGKHISVEHWDHAMNHGQHAAKNIIKGNSIAYTVVPYFWSDQYDKRLQYFGHSKNWKNTLLRGSIDDGMFSYFYLDENNIIEAALLVNKPKEAISVRRLIKEQKPIDINALADTNIKLKKCISSV